MRMTPNRLATRSAAALARARPSVDGSAKRLVLPLSGVRPARLQPIVPLRSATTLFGRPALISDCAPMMLRVRPAQLTTTIVLGEGAMSWMRSTSSAPGTLVALGVEARWGQHQQAQRDRARPKQVIAREEQLLTQIAQRQFAAIAEHGFDRMPVERFRLR